MKITSLIVITALFVALDAQIISAQSGHELYQRALTKERAVGDVEEALRLYRRVVSEFGKNRALAAKAQYRMGLLHDRLGQKAEAQRAYKAVVGQYPDQIDIVRQAQARIVVANTLGAKATSVHNSFARNIATQQVWAGADADSFGAPASDGRYLSCVDWSTGDLAIRDLSTGEKRRLTNKGSWMASPEFALYSLPSPDGNQIAYAWLNKDSGFSLRIIHVDRGEPKVLHHNADDAYLQPCQWSRDGRQILALISKKDRTNQIAMVSVTDGSVRVLKTLDWRYPLMMRLSADGRFIVYDLAPQEKSPKRDIFLLDTDGSREISLVQHGADDYFPVWTPDGRRVVFVSDRTGTPGLWSLAVVDGRPQGPPELVKSDMGRMLPMGFTDNGALYYGLSVDMTDVYTATLDISAGRILEAPVAVSQRFAGSNRSPDWSPDGRYLSYVSQRNFGPAQAVTSPIVIHSQTTGEERELIAGLATSRRPRWWPDGRSFVIGSQDEKGLAGIYRVDAQTGAATLLFQPGNSNFLTSPSWTSDGKHIFYYYPRGNVLAILMRNLESGEEKELYRENTAYTFAMQLAVSPDDQLLAFTASQKDGQSIMLLPIAGGSPQELLQVRFPERIRYGTLAWTPDGQNLLFAREKPPKPVSLFRIPAKGGEPKYLGLEMVGLNTVRVNPDGRRIAFGAGDNKVEVWVMENFLPPARQVRKVSVSKR